MSAETEAASPTARGTQPLGLALSGGGFRASLFHVGVLARMAELNLLRHVTVISTVSGGSIVGAKYFLKLFHQLPATQEQYLQIVWELARDLRRSLRHNVRARAFLNPFKNFDMFIRPEYSRSDRIGDLLDKLFYRDEWQASLGSRYAVIDQQIELQWLKRRGLPELCLNATCLNSGHRWCFTPYGMGELRPAEGTPRGLIFERIDRNVDLRFMFFEEVPRSQQDFPLGLAVAASACFPGLFSPLPISNLYPGMRIRLQDGGVHDNQAVEAIRDNKCESAVVSDASGQLEDQGRPSPVLPLLIARIVSIYGDRVREEQLTAMQFAVDEAPVKQALVHLREGLPRTVIMPLDPEGKERPSVVEPAPTVDGISVAAEWKLARVRTDLDAFNDVEAYALMLAGYRIARAQLTPANLPAELFSEEVEPTEPWPFLRASAIVSNPTQRQYELLATASKRLLRPFFAPLIERLVWQALAFALLSVILWRYGHSIASALDERELWLGLVVAAPLTAVLPASGWLGARMIEATLRRLFSGPSGAAIGRWLVRVLGVAGSVITAWAVGGWGWLWRELDIEWGTLGTTALTAAVIASPPLGAFVVGILTWADGRVHLLRGGLSQPFRVN